MNIKRGIKLFLGALATIFLGAIGSGLWEKVLSPFLSYLSRFFTSTLSSISSSYATSIYTRAAKLYGSDSPTTVGLALMLLVFSGLFFYALASKKDNLFIQILHRAIIFNFSGWVGLIYSGAFVIVLLFLLSTENTVQAIKNYSHRQLEIIHPYIEEHQYLLLRSQYITMRSRQDFDQFQSKLIALASEKHVSIEKFETK